MLRHKGLYKEQTLALSPCNHNARNRELQKKTRANQRNKCFQNNRDINLSLTPTLPIAGNGVGPAAKENQQPQIKSDLDNQKVATTEASVQKFTRQELYLQRFMKWKADCKKKYQKIKPRIPQAAQSKSDTDAPQAPFLKTSETFRPPDNLQKHNGLESRRSLYLVIEPTKQESQEAAAKSNKPVSVKTHSSTVKTPFVPIMPTLQKVKPHTAATIVKPSKTAVKPQISGTKPQPSKVKPQTSASRPARIPSEKTMPPPPVSTITKPKLPNLMVEPFSKPVNSKPTFSKAGRATGKAQTLKSQPIRRVGGGGGAVGGGAAGKFKKTEMKSSQTIHAHLSTRMKSKQAAPGKHTKIVLKELLQPAEEIVIAPPQTPLDTSDNPFHSQVTSTQCRSNNNSCANLMDAFGDALDQISPVVPLTNDSKINREGKVKRQLIAPEELPLEGINVGIEELPVEEKETAISGQRKYNFIKCESMIESPSIDAVTIINATTDEVTLKPEPQKQEQHTPPRRNSISNTNVNYLSPFVTCSRGKVNSRNEKEKRNSMYLQDPETPLEVRLALESVNYFRQQLAQEIERLHGLCNEWQEYCQLHQARLLETDCLDMINVAIGQTKLLTSKKMMQFSGLIDRCEAGAKGTNNGPNDGSEDSKPVLAKDLEGWWDLLKLGSDNLDKRFSTLNKWRDNNWLDPDAAPEVKPKRNLVKTMKAKPKAKASSSLKQFLLNAKLKHKKQAAELADAEQNATLTTGNPGTPTSRRSQRVIVVRDRKSFSPARTVLRVSRSGESPRSSICGTRSSANELLKSAIMGATLQQTTPPPPPASMKSRASILKTPGTIKRENANRGVIFSAKKNVRRFQFTFDEGGEPDKTGGGDMLEDCEEDMSLEESTLSATRHKDGEEVQMVGVGANTSRTYTLRNRKVKLRPSSEFM